MKKLITATLMVATMGLNAIASETTAINSKITAGFKQEFAEAKDVQWKVGSDFIKASFKQDGEAFEVFYNQEGDKIGESRKIATETIPMAARKEIAKKYEGFNITEAIEFTNDNSTKYYVSVDNGKLKYVLEVSSYNEVSVFKKIKK